MSEILEPDGTTAATRPSTALLTDRYELGALAASLADGSGARRSAFEVFARHLPEGRRYGVVAGVDRVVDAIESFRFDAEALRWVADEDIVGPAALDWLAGYRFGGDVDAYAEGELYFPASPVLTVSGTFAECIVLETVILSILNHDSAIAAAAARMVDAADGRRLIEMGSRRTHEDAAVAAARAAYICGFDATSNLAAGRRFGVPTAGTSMHSFTLAHESELGAFRSQIATQGVATTLLVDTYDIATGIATAVQAAGEVGATGPGGIRLDSGDPLETVPAARRQLDQLGAVDTAVVVTGNLDEYRIRRIAATPTDAYGVGTSLVSGSGHPAAELVYKLVAIEADDGSMRPVAKASIDKANRGGRKWAFRALDIDGMAISEVIVGDPATVPASGARMLTKPFIRGGWRCDAFDIEAARLHHRSAMNELRPELRSIDAGRPAFSAETWKEAVVR